MQNKPMPAEGTSSTKLKTESALRGAACSPSVSDTPETDLNTGTYNHQGLGGCVPSFFAKTLERRLNRAISLLVKIDRRMTGNELYEHGLMGGDATPSLLVRDFLLENAERIHPHKND